MYKSAYFTIFIVQVEYAVVSGNTAGSYDTKTETNAIPNQCQKKSLDYYKLRETDTNLAGINVVVVFILRFKFFITV